MVQPALTDSIVARFPATVGFDGEASEARRVVVTKRQLCVQGATNTRRIDREAVFDIVRDVSSTSRAESTEIVTIAFDTGSRRETLTIQAAAATLVRFQRVLFKQLFAETTVGVRYRGANDVTSTRRQCQLRISAQAIQLMPTDGSTHTRIDRRDITKFDQSESDSSTVVLYVSTESRVERVSIQFPSFRLVNLFGRYVRADLLTVDALGTTADERDTVEVLLVDDDAQSRELTTVFLTERTDRLSVTEAGSAREAKSILDPSAPAVDCIVSDYKMPGMDGIEFLNVVRDTHPTLPFILYTGQGSEQVAKRAILDNVTDYVQKDVGPAQYETLIERIEKAVR